MDYGMEAPGAFFHTQQGVPQHQQAYINHNSYGELRTSRRMHSAALLTTNTGYAMQNSGQYPAMNLEYQTQRSHHRHQSTSTQSSYSSAFRSSNGSSFSQWDPRSSVASTNTTWSQFSGTSREQHVAQAESALDSNNLVTSSIQPATFDESIALPSFKRTAPRQQAPKKDPFETCMSRTKRTRPPQKIPRYWCTSCREGFGEKYDWKRHEETYQERTVMFECNNCTNIYFLDKDFINHHQKSHRCRVCAEKQHVELARRQRMLRTGWGCGFCSHFSADWAERCNHISWHFEKDNKTMDDWHHSQVIFSLLQRPEIFPQWNRYLEIKQRTHSPFRWKIHNTGRVEGYPESNPQAQLQDLLEYFAPNQSISAIVRLAFEKGLKEKELPRLPEPEIEPGPIAQQNISQPTQPPFATHNLVGNVPSWTAFLGTIPEDDLQPTDVCTLDYDALTAAFNDTHQNYHFTH
jgi:hypothetical protein